MFSKTFTDPLCIIKAFCAFLCFTATSSSIYILNDIIDIEKDRHHETKRFRPLLREVQRRCLDIYGGAFNFWPCYSLLINFNVVIFILAYIIMNILYSLFLKRL